MPFWRLLFFQCSSPAGLYAKRGSASRNNHTTAASDETSKPLMRAMTKTAIFFDNLPDDLNFQNAEVTFLIWEDCPMLEFFVEGLNGEIINDAIFERNRIVEDRLGVKLNYVATLGNDTHMAAYMQKAEADLTSGACEYDIYAGYSRTAPAMVLSGHCEELTGLDYLDYDMPWWPDTLLEQCLVNDRMYSARRPFHQPALDDDRHLLNKELVDSRD